MVSVGNILWNREEARLRAGWRLLLQFAILFLFMIILAILDSILADSLPRSPMGESDSVLLPIELLAAFLLSVWCAGRFLDRRRFADFGFRLSPSWWFDLGFGLALGALMMTAIFLIELVTGWVTITGTFKSGINGVTFPMDILWALVTFICVGIYEELLGRGYQLKNLAEGLNLKSFSPKGAIVLAALDTSAFFGLLHAFNPHASMISTLNLMLAGILYATAYLLTGELAIPIGYHIMWNFFEGSVFGFPVSGFDPGMAFIAIRQSGPRLWMGGAFGPEAGLLGTGARLVGILLIIGWVRLRYGKVSLQEKLATPDLLIRKHEQA
jgi:membrane protease YdiL (CAAX protease family)